jgi:hypothetical protein
LRLYCWFSHSKTIIVHTQEKKSFALKGQRSFNPPQRGGLECPKRIALKGQRKKYYHEYSLQIFININNIHSKIPLPFQGVGNFLLRMNSYVYFLFANHHLNLLK